jgi:CDP-glucose 4,6-dehydratase
MNWKRIGPAEMQNGKSGKMELQSVFKNKKVFVTGHTGFKGSWLITWLHQLGASVKGYALEPEAGNNLYQLIKGDELCTSVIADIRDGERVKNEIVGFEPDFVFHLAAQPLVQFSYQVPVYTFEVNVTGTAHVLDALRYIKNPCVAVMITTDKVYLNHEKDYCYKEEDKLGGYDPYSASKACAELVIDSYRNSFFNPGHYKEHLKSISSARAGNVIGGGDWAKDRIIPDLIRALSSSLPVPVRNPHSVRPWEHVLEPLYGYLVLAAHQYRDPVQYAQSYNFGPSMDDKLSVMDLVKKAIDVWGKGSYENLYKEGAGHEASLLQLDITKAGKELKWTPKFTTEQAIELTVNWYKRYLGHERDARSLIKEDINNIAI